MARSLWFGALAPALALLVAGCSTGGGALPGAAQAGAEAPARASHGAGTAFYVADFTSVTSYDSPSGSPLQSITKSVQFPDALAFDTHTNLYVADGAGGVHDGGMISEFAPGSLSLVRTIKAGIKGPFSLATDSADNLYCANQFANSVTVYDSNGKLSRTIRTGVAVPVVVLVDPLYNDVYVANTSTSGGKGTVTEYASGSGTPSRTIVAGVDTPLSLALDRLGNLYVGNYVGHTVTEYAVGSVSPALTISVGTAPTALAVDAKNNLYVADYARRGVVEYAAGTSTVLRKIVAGIDFPRSLAIDPAGNLIVANYGTNSKPGSVTIYGPAGTSPLRKITSGIVSPLALAIPPQLSIGP